MFNRQDAGKLHEEIVRVLAIDQRLPVERFTNLEDLPITALADRGRIQAEHDVGAEAVTAAIAHQHPHPPVRDDELVAATRPALRIEQAVDDAILHQMDAWRGRVLVSHLAHRALCRWLRCGGSGLLSWRKAD